MRRTGRLLALDASEQLGTSEQSPASVMPHPVLARRRSRHRPARASLAAAVTGQLREPTRERCQRLLQPRQARAGDRCRLCLIVVRAGARSDARRPVGTEQHPFQDARAEDAGFPRPVPWCGCLRETCTQGARPTPAAYGEATAAYGAGRSANHGPGPQEPPRLTLGSRGAGQARPHAARRAEHASGRY
jgi:hypothetical protein